MAISLREKCLYSEFFWSVYFRIRTEYAELLRISSYSIRMREYTDRLEKLRHFSSNVSPNYLLRLEITRLFGSSLRRCSVRKGVLRNFKKFTGKRLCQSLLFNKAAGCAKLLRTPFLTKHPQATTYEYLIL